MHFLGDGMALHNFANEFFGLLGSDRTDSDLRVVLEEEWRVRWGEGIINDVSLYGAKGHGRHNPDLGLSMIHSIGVNSSERPRGPDALAVEQATQRRRQD